MKKVITLYLPNYFDKQTVDGSRLVCTKTKPLLKGDFNDAKFVASIEKVENFQCAIPEIGEEYQQIATKCFHRDRANKWELPQKVSNCKVYTYNWDDESYHFRIYWIVITEKFMLQVVGFFKPTYSSFYKRHFITHLQNIEIDRTFDFSKTYNPKEIFACKPVNIAVEELQELINVENEKQSKTRYLEENLKTSCPNFYDVLIGELEENEEVSVEKFIFTDWIMYYDLHNVENFSDPDSTVEWEDNSDIYEYYEKPNTDTSKLNIVCEESFCDLNALKNLIKNKDKVEEKVLSFFEDYTFGNGGAYADAIHYQWVKIEIERFHNTTYTNQEFLKRNICLEEIILRENTDDIKLNFICSWDTEHGAEVILDKKLNCRINK